MSDEQAIHQAIRETMARDAVPGLAVAIAWGDQPVRLFVHGTDSSGRPLTDDSLFPAASITKLATALAIHRLAETGALTVDDPLSDHLPEAAAAQAGVTLRRLLCHTSGLPGDLPPEAAPYQQGLDWPRLARACLETPLEHPPATGVRYSNVGYGLLAVVVERKTGRPFADALASLVLEPLGIEGYLGVEPPRAPATIGDVPGNEVGTPLETFNSAFWRSLALPWGGLLATTAGALAIVRAFHGRPSDFLRPETRADATRNQVGDLAGGIFPPFVWPRCPWGLGPELRGDKAPHYAPAQASPESFGHAGASGCVAWIDPTADVAWTVFGTRTIASHWLSRGCPAIGAAALTSSG